MSMTKEEAILLSAYTGFLLVPDFSDVHKFCEDTLGRPILTHEFRDQDVQKEIQDKLRSQIMELIQNIAALRPVSREQVEKVFPGCDFCEIELDDYPYIVAHSDYSSSDTCYEPSFCPICGKPMTDKAVQMVMERWEALQCGN